MNLTGRLSSFRLSSLNRDFVVIVRFYCKSLIYTGCGKNYPLRFFSEQSLGISKRNFIDIFSEHNFSHLRFVFLVLLHFVRRLPLYDCKSNHLGSLSCPASEVATLCRFTNMLIIIIFRQLAHSRRLKIELSTATASNRSQKF